MAKGGRVLERRRVHQVSPVVRDWRAQASQRGKPAIDYDGRTTIGNVSERSLAEIVGAPEVRDMTRAFMAGEAAAVGCEHCRGVKPLFG